VEAGRRAEYAAQLAAVNDTHAIHGTLVPRFRFLLIVMASNYQRGQSRLPNESMRLLFQDTGAINDRSNMPVREVGYLFVSIF
jgi:hypothetical protein